MTKFATNLFGTKLPQVVRCGYFHWEIHMKIAKFRRDKNSLLKFSKKITYIAAK